jgi:hypothetical protein
MMLTLILGVIAGYVLGRADQYWRSRRQDQARADREWEQRNNLWDWM